ncbi:MAG: GNAT family N-acetyltransferase [Ignavibacteria bacterium]|nr:GNAT family N-acetyltransferase [Ignavibacteria bacterium]
MKVVEANITNTGLIKFFLSELYIELGEEQESIVFLTDELISSMMNNGKTQVFLIEDNEKFIGLLTLTESQSIYAGGKYGVIDEMYMLPEYRSKQAGELLVNKAKEIAIEKKWKRIDVTAPTEERWKRTVAFYEKCGFVFTGPKLKYQF